MPGECVTGSENPAAVLEVGMKGAGVVWLNPEPTDTTTDQSTTGPVWHVWADGACYLLTGPGEQPLPGIVHGGQCQVTARNGSGGRAVTWSATVEALDPTGTEWAVVAPKLAAGRLNGVDPAAVLPTWPGRVTILCLRPTGALATAETGLADDSQAVARKKPR